MSETPLIEVSRLSRSYFGEGTETKALQNVSLRITTGQYVSIMGASGSGKSTLLHLLGLLDRPTGGTYLLKGQDTSQLTDEQLATTRNEELGFVFQSFHLLPRASVLQNVMLPLHYSSVPQSEHEERATGVLKSVHMDHRLHHRPDQLSGGEKQRTAIARALVNNPPILFADEPTGNLDSKTGETVMDVLDTLHSQGRTIIVITHDSHAAARAEHTFRLHDGKLMDTETREAHNHE